LQTNLSSVIFLKNEDVEGGKQYMYVTSENEEKSNSQVVDIRKKDNSTPEETSKKALRVLMVTGIYPTEQNPHSGTFIKTQVDSLNAAGLEVEVIHPKPGPLPIRYVSAALQLYHKILTGHFDIVHGHYGHWCMLARMQWKTPVVASFIGSDLLGERNADGLLSKKGLLIRYLSRWLSLHVDATTVKSEGMKKVVLGNNTIVYPDGIDFNLFHPISRVKARTALGWDQDGYYVLFGNDPRRPEKNISLAKAAIERMHGRGIAAELVVATGLPQKKVMEYINASNALILSSIYEGSPNIVKEAMACNVSVVSTDVGDVADVIGRTKGCSVCPHDPDALAAGLELALRHTGPTTGRADIRHLECSVVANQIIAVYEQVLRKKAKK
jgi:glycosyltransferase involved in cell wall biosynthesis